jgi:aminomethyltransferase
MNHWGRFRVTGADAAALLHHLTTNDVKKLRSGNSLDAALITSKGRLLDFLTIFRDTSGFTVLTAPNRRTAFAPHAKQFILYRQEITIEDVSANGVWIGLFGPQAEAALRERGLEIPEGNAIAQTAEVSVARTNRLPGGGFFVWSKSDFSFDVPYCDNETFNILRIEEGIPVAGLEVVDTFNPWEAGFDNAISLAKGCYNGQEIIARLNTYQKVKQHLRGVKLESLPAEFPVDLKAEGKPAGVLSSAAVSPRFGAIGLAYVRSAHETGATLQAGDQTATVVALPFE